MHRRESSLADHVTDAVRRAIIEGRLPTGARLTESRLAEEHQTSRVPVREALRRLESEGFVTVARNRGATVASLSVGEARSLLEVRSVLESLVARSAAQRCTPEDLTALRETVAAGERALAAGEREPLIELNTTFHRQLAVASGNLVAADLLGQLRRKIEWIYSRRLSDRAEDSWREHAAIVDAIAEGDVAGAETLLGAHIHNAQRALQLTGAVDAAIEPEEDAESAGDPEPDDATG